MGFFSKMAEALETPQKKAFRKNIANFPDFQSQKHYWSCDESSMLAFDESKTRVLLAINCGSSFTERMEIIAKAPKGVKPDEYLNDNWWNIRVVNLTDLISSAVVEDGNSLTQTSRSSQAVGAIVGGALLGGAGTIIGGLSGSKKNINTVSNLQLAVIINDIEQPRFTLTFINKEIPKNNSLYKDTKVVAEEIDSILTVLIRRADAESEKSQSQALPNDNTSIADELTKLAELLSAGHITAEEYRNLKAKMIEKYS